MTEATMGIENPLLFLGAGILLNLYPGPDTLSFIVLGMVFITTGTAWCVIVAIFSSSLGNHLRGSEKTAIRLRRINGVLFTLLGLKLATSQIS